MAVRCAEFGSGDCGMDYLPNTPTAGVCGWDIYRRGVTSSLERSTEERVGYCSWSDGCALVSVPPDPSDMVFRSRG